MSEMAALICCVQEHTLSDAVSPVPLPPPGPIRTITVLSAGLLFTWLVGATVQFISGRSTKRERAVQQDLMAQQEAVWKSRLEEAGKQWESRLEKTKEQLEQEYQGKLLSQLGAKDAEVAVKLLAKEEEVRRLLEEGHKKELEAVRKEGKVKLRTVEEDAKNALAQEREATKEVWH